jgi:hypothetical protein
LAGAFHSTARRGFGKSPRPVHQSSRRGGEKSIPATPPNFFGIQLVPGLMRIAECDNGWGHLYSPALTKPWPCTHRLCSVGPLEQLVRIFAGAIDYKTN